MKIGYELGLEQVGQIHPDNPFGMANLWFDESQNRWIWLDTIPAIRHTGWVWPLFYFGFHNDVRREFKADQPTFNRIHSDRFIATLYRFRSAFSRGEYKEIMADLALYDNLLREEKMAQARDGRDMKAAADAFSATVEDVITERFIYKIIASPSFRKEKLETLMKVLRDPIYRAYFINKNVILSGIERARKEGLVSEEELRQAWQAVEVTDHMPKDVLRRRIVLTTLQFYYIVTSEILNFFEASSYAKATLTDEKWYYGLGIFIGWVLPSILRTFPTSVVGIITNVDLKTAASISKIPKLGGWTAVAAQIAVNGESRTQAIWHYKVREIIAALSKISPSGGWGTQLEAQLWNRLGKRLEALGKQEIDINSK